VPARETRKTVTALFSDVVESTSPGERLDPVTRVPELGSA
jgi:hypothetical protein